MHNHNHRPEVSLWTALEGRCPDCTARYQRVVAEVPDFHRLHVTAQAHYWRTVL